VYIPLGKNGEKCSSGSTKLKSLMSRSSTWSMSSMVLSKASSMTHLMTHLTPLISVHVFVWKRTFWSISSSPSDIRQLFCIPCLLILWTLSKCYCVKCSRVLPDLVLCILQGSVVTPIRCGGKYDMDFVGYFTGNTAVKNLEDRLKFISYERI